MTMKLFKQIRVPKKSANLNCNKKTNNLELLSKYKIEELILPHLSIGKRGFKTKFDLIKILPEISLYITILNSLVSLL